MDFSFLKKKNTYFILLGSILVLYIVLKAFSIGNDINVYLYASEQLFRGENIYADNPYNFYLYSPIFALLLGPLTLFDYGVARILWALFNTFLAYRLWKISYNLISDSFALEKKTLLRWTIGTIIISIGFLNHNLILGQVTILILWLTFEGLYQIIYRDKTILGSILLALGILIKIIPLLALFYLFFKKKIKSIAYSLLFVVVGLFLPALFVGYSYNMEMHSNWADTINPSNKKYVFENNDGTQSLNAIIPAYFYDLEKIEEPPAGLRRQIISVPHDTLVIILQATRVLVLLSLLILIFYRRKSRENKALYFYWEFAYLALVSTLIFPHQQKYVMLYFVPAGAYILLFSLLIAKLNWRVESKYKIIALVSLTLMLISAIMGRDIVGNFVVDIFDYYHVFGLINILFMAFLLMVPPNKLNELYKRGKEGSQQVADIGS